VRGSFKQKSKRYLNDNNTGVPSHWLHAMTVVLAALVTATAVLGAWTLAILKVKCRLENAAAIHRRLARGQDLSRL
jgi:cytochrome oxidase assembly protein ShyY1